MALYKSIYYYYLLLLLFGTIASLLTTIQTMISVLREKIHGVVFREMLQMEHRITSTKIPFQRQWLMPYYQPLKP